MVPSRVLTVCAALVLSASALAADPAPKPAELIVGCWEGETRFTVRDDRKNPEVEVFTRKMRAEFLKDGTVTVIKDRIPGVDEERTSAAKYAFVKNGELELAVEAGEGEKVVRLKFAVTVTKDELSLAEVGEGKGPPVKFKRAKD